MVAADTVVVLGDAILGKPRDEADAASMLESLSGRTHRVLTGFCILAATDTSVEAISTEVTFRDLDREVIERYVSTGEPMDKAGAYGIQAGGGALVRGIVGSYSNVVGLPLAETLEAIAALGGPRR